MDVRELRIGILVEYDGLPCKVKLIEESGLAVLFEDGEDIWIDIWQFSPISITEKWLLKFGFKKNKYRSHFYTLGDYDVFYEDNEWFFVICNYMENPPSVNMYYVHQLQNLYYCISGKELTYE